VTITSNDIKLMQPQRLSDEDDGGGQMTGLEVIDGDINNLFEDISRIDRTYGNVSLRKAFLKVDTATADLYLDAHAILSAQPADPNVTALLFTTDDFYDEREKARQRIESFVVAGPVTGLFLRGTQLQGQRAIICYSPTINGSPAPEVGDTFMLQTLTNISSQQFVKVVNVQHTSERFTYFIGSTGDVRTFDADQYVLQLSSELKQDYPANDPAPRPVNDSKIYSTQPATSAKYFGSTTLAETAPAGSTSLRVVETFAPIIPTASSETPVIDQRPGGFINTVIASTTETISLSATIANNTTTELPTAVVPGSASFSAGGANYTDRGGIFVNSGGVAGALEGSTIDYKTGAVQWVTSLASTPITITYQPGAVSARLPNTGRIDIDDTNRNFNYVLSLDPAPAPGTFNASYQYLGKWYELQDNGAGQLIGEGSGQVNYATGSVILTLQAQPDASSVIFFRWTDNGTYVNAVEDAFNATTPVDLTLANRLIVPGSVTITWVSGGVAKSATEMDGIVSGDATGLINYATGVISLTSAPSPDVDTDWSVEYTYKSDGVLTVVDSVAATESIADFTLNSAENLQPGSVSFILKKSIKQTARNEVGTVIAQKYYSEDHQIADNGSGGLVDKRASSEVVGSINYTTGLITIFGAAFIVRAASTEMLNNAVLAKVITVNSVVYASGYSATDYNYVLLAQDVTINYQHAAGSGVEVTDVIAQATTKWRFMLAKEGPVLPGSVVLSVAGELWFDDGAGRLLKSYNTSTGVGVVVGTIDYQSSLCVIDKYSGSPLTASVTTISCIVGNDWSLLLNATFRTAAAPLRPNGFNVRADKFDQTEQFNAQADNDGDLSGDGVTGTVDLQKGLADITFPEPVIASTVFYNAVSYKQIPLDPDILGLDPVRLPSDGRVPILRDADILVMTHTAKDLIESPVDGLVIDAGRDKLYSAWIEDSAGTNLDPDQYTLDKDAGTATLATPFIAQDADSNALVGDLYYVHRVDDMALCTEARIDGTLQLAQPIYHDLPANETWVASAVYLGDLRGRVKDLGCYTTDPGFGGTGTASSGQYNDINYPIAIDNRGSVPERWKIIFTSTSAFRLVGEHYGQVSTGSIAVDFSPTNPQSGTPYFTIESDGWGGGWATGNTVLFETDAAAAPLWFIRTVLPGQATLDNDELKIELRGDHN
jgi:hypothetical protein